MIATDLAYTAALKKSWDRFVEKYGPVPEDRKTWAWMQFSIAFKAGWVAAGGKLKLVALTVDGA